MGSRAGYSILNGVFVTLIALTGGLAWIAWAVPIDAGMAIVIEREFHKAAIWCVVAAALSATGLMHSYAWTFGDTVLSLSPAWPFVIAYGSMAVLFGVAPYVTTETEGHG